MTAQIYHLARPRPPQHGLTGLFWMMPECWQRDRIRELARQFPPEAISTLCRTSLREVNHVIETARQSRGNAA